MTVRDVRKFSTGMEGMWTAVDTGPAGYALRCGDVELCTVNGRKPRVFRSLDAVRHTLTEEIGVTEFRVEVKN